MGNGANKYEYHIDADDPNGASEWPG